MYTYTSTHKFLVLAPIQSGPSSITGNQVESKTNPSAPQVRERSDSESSTTTSTQLGEGLARLPSGFLYLGHGTPRVSSPSL